MINRPRAFLPIFIAMFFASRIVMADQYGTNVVPLAETYLSSLTQEQLAKDKSASVENYLDWFFRGFVDPSGAVGSISETVQTAYKEGQIYWRSRPEMRDEIMKSYGYVRIDEAGIWMVSYEFSTLFLDNPRRACYMRTLGHYRIDQGLSEKVKVLTDSSGKLSVRVVGYISPLGRYGHLGTNSCAIFAERIDAIE